MSIYSFIPLKIVHSNISKQYSLVASELLKCTSSKREYLNITKAENVKYRTKNVIRVDLEITFKIFKKNELIILPEKILIINREIYCKTKF